jgi:hypothetical protein
MQVHTNKESREKQPGRKPGPNQAEMGLGRPTEPSPLRARFGDPFALGVRLFIASLPPSAATSNKSFYRRHSPENRHSKMRESWMSSSQGSTPVEGRKQEEDSKPLA